MRDTRPLKHTRFLSRNLQWSIVDIRCQKRSTRLREATARQASNAQHSTRCLGGDFVATRPGVAFHLGQATLDVTYTISNFKSAAPRSLI